MNLEEQRRHQYFKLLICGYAALLFVLCVSRFYLLSFLLGAPQQAVCTVNLTPFHSMWDRWQHTFRLSWDGLGNLLMFIPLGVLFCYTQKKNRFLGAVSACFGISVGIETLQYLLKTGAVDIDDVILNTLGGVIGAVIFWVIGLLSGEDAAATRRKVELYATIFPPFLLFYTARFFWGGRYTFRLWHGVLVILYFIPVYFAFLRGCSKKEKILYGAATCIFFVYFFFLFL